MAGLYIHIPFCAKKCIYCDFYSIGTRNAPWKEYVESLLCELSQRKSELTEPVYTIYIGGGTPSLMPLGMMTKLIAGIKMELQNQYKPVEFTIEVNPDDVKESLIDTYISMGVNRISMGVQSFNDEELQRIKRRHSSSQVFDAYELLKKFENISLDLIFGLPGQTIESWSDNLSKIIDLRPKHISAYSLMYEDGTVLNLMKNRGEISETDEDLSFKMFQMLITRLSGAGYKHYEISNFAIPGYESNHNSNYWNGVQYLGLGASAHSFDGERCRRANPASVSKYIQNYYTDKYPLYHFYEEETLSDSDLHNEYIMTRLRCLSGIKLDDFYNRFGSKMLTDLLRKAAKFVNSGMLYADSNDLRLTEKGVLISDNIFIDLMI